MMRSVSRSNGTNSCVMPGNPGAIAPSPPTFGTVRFPIMTIAVTTTIATSGAGTAIVKRGMIRMMATESRNSG